MRLRFVISEIGAGFRRNATMISAVILVTLVSLAAVGAALLTQMQVNKLRATWSEEVEVAVMMCPANKPSDGNCQDGGATADQLGAVEKIVRSQDLRPYVSSLTVDTPAQVLAESAKVSGEDVTQSLTAKDFGTLLHIKLKGPDDYEIVEQAVQDQPGVYQIVDQNNLIGPLFSILSKAQIAAIGIAVVLMIAAILLISTTIRLSAMSRRRETGIMRLVGASNLFIQLPFMLEGAVAALCGSILSVVGLWAITKFWLADWIKKSFGSVFVSLNPSDVFQVAPWLILAAVVLAALSSVVTLRRFTKV
ncbi:MAG: permease-like cell division protein FtsX [Bifidobacteriaceae bacterium]|nr:permease-like cell division protein FtsX [Bifidobacteriaceae bacterium]